MERWSNRVALVTGASSGIGAAIAKDLVLAGVKVVALGRRLERIEKNHSELPDNVKSQFYPRKCDVTNKDDVAATFEWIESTLGGTDILVNNAGISKRGQNLLDMDLEKVDDVINTNMRGLVYCSQAAFKSMKARNFDGHIVHINSIYGHKVPFRTAGQSSNIYSPTKHAVTAITEVMRNELINFETKIKITSISPGLVRTEIIPDEVFEKIGCYLNPSDISQAVLFAIGTPPHVQIHEMTVKPVGEFI
ncbi:farnesol dehydrogenase-like [Episyrphus balteatus]|uniref:farnesol dehydrogenase-like n=1 Tax=Episyrphus balteatus TaxID=286459 RepID=UPI0024852B77|nr:farnesol dehydrogenase-like [Episyrphus balteatus]